MQQALQTSRTYDEFGRVLTKTVIDKGKYDTVNYEYDIITGVDEGCTAEYSTDPKNNLTTKVYDAQTPETFDGINVSKITVI